MRHGDWAKARKKHDRRFRSTKPKRDRILQLDCLKAEIHTLKELAKLRPLSLTEGRELNSLCRRLRKLTRKRSKENVDPF